MLVSWPSGVEREHEGGEINRDAEHQSVAGQFSFPESLPGIENQADPGAFRPSLK